jgi:excisionase family DNA binding protein
MQARQSPANPVSIREAAAHLHVSQDTVRRRISAGELTGYRLGKRIVRVDLDELETLFRVIPATNGVEESV